MKFGLMYANAGPFAFPEMLTHLATTAERTGVESIWAVEHVVIPVGYQSTYPYDPSGKIPAPPQVPMPDPLIALAYAAAVTKTLRLATGILILPQRHPLYVAKEVASLDVLSGGRLILGSASAAEEEFQSARHPVRERRHGPPRRCGPCARCGSRSLRRSPESSSRGPRVAPEAGAAARGAYRGRRHTEIARRAAHRRRRLLPGVTDEDKLSGCLRSCVRRQGGTRPAAIEITSGRGAPDADACAACRSRRVALHGAASGFDPTASLRDSASASAT